VAEAAGLDARDVVRAVQRLTSGGLVRVADGRLRIDDDDHAALRRYLVDEGLLGRGAGEYWRTGGTVEID
jgi:hypothetical protein